MSLKPYKNKWSADDALNNMKKWCAEQERCHSEVRRKLLEHSVHGDELEQVIAQLITEGFLNEERYARAYASGKLRMNHWGWNKILANLKMKQISPYCIKMAYEAIDQEEYIDILNHLISKKTQEIKETDYFKRRQKIIRYLIQKGFEIPLITEILDKD